MRRIRRSLLAALVDLGLAATASAQIIPWSEPPALADKEKFPSRPRPRVGRRAAKVAPSEVALRLPFAVAPDESLVAAIVHAPSLPDTVVLATFDATVGAGSVRTGTSWAGQVTQHASSLAVAGTAADDNGWGATGLSLDATPFTYLNLTAQRDAGNVAPTLFLLFEDRTLRTKVYSLSTSLFAVGTLTTVQIPLDGWTINFGTGELTGWSIGGGSVGTVPFRLTFDELAFTTSAIPEPRTYAALLGLFAGLAVVWRRRAFALRRRQAD